jgi:hypothetical protein
MSEVIVKDDGEPSGDETVIGTLAAEAVQDAAEASAEAEVATEKAEEAVEAVEAVETQVEELEAWQRQIAETTNKHSMALESLAASQTTTLEAVAEIRASLSTLLQRLESSPAMEPPPSESTSDTPPTALATDASPSEPAEAQELEQAAAELQKSESEVRQSLRWI